MNDLSAVESIFLTALEKGSPAERAVYLDAACGRDTELRRHVERLLNAHENAGEFLQGPDPAQIATGDAPSSDPERPGAVIGPYKLLQAIGEGGMGVVFMAEQSRPVRRKVALKVIKPGMDTKQVIARFEAERQALALMDHPNIAKVLDAGATESGRPYFVMELVRGIPITDYCDREHLAIPERLELFVQVCQAVQHAHQKGIIHRDLKPSNILVTLHDGAPVPRIIDFGVAKAMGQQLTEKTLFTGFAQLVGTPLYMSPEQAEVSGLDIDTRSDIYSLGVLLYELLTGTTPFDPETLRKAALDEVRRIIREEEPPKPSTRLSTLGATLADVSAKRGSEPRRLGKVVRGELDWIVMKALEKDRNRRYETINGLAADVRRYLDDEPVQACPPSVWYRFTKSARRNRVALVTSALVATALVLGTAVSIWQAVLATRAEGRAQTEASIAQAVNDFLREDLLAQASPDIQSDRDLKLRTVLDRAAGRIAGRFERQPLVEAALRQTLGDTYAALGLDREAEPHFERARDLRLREVGVQHPGTLEAMVGLAGVYQRTNQFDKAVRLLVRVLEVGRRTPGEDHPVVLQAMGRLGAVYRDQGKLKEAEPLIVETLERCKRALGEAHHVTLIAMIDRLRLYSLQHKGGAEGESLARKGLEISRRTLGEEHPDTLIFMTYHGDPVKGLEISRRTLGEEHGITLTFMNNVAAMYSGQGKLAEAEALLVKGLEISRRKLGEEDEITLSLMGHLATNYEQQGKLAEAEALRVKRLEISRRTLGEEHTKTLGSMAFLAVNYELQGKLVGAEVLLVKALEISRRGRGEEQSDALHLMEILASCYAEQGKLAEAERLLTQALEVERRVLGPRNPETLGTLTNLASMYDHRGQFEKAERLLTQALKVERRVLGPENPETLKKMNYLAITYNHRGQFEKAEQLFMQVLDVERRVLGPEHPDTLWTMNNLAVLYQDRGQLEKAETLWTQVLDVARRVLGPEDPRTLTTMNNLAGLYSARGQFEKAELLFIQALDGKRRVLGPEHPGTLTGMNNLAALYLDLGKYAKAELLSTQALSLARRILGGDHPDTANAMSVVGRVLLKEQKYAEAETILRECLSIRKKTMTDDWVRFYTESLLGGSLLGRKNYTEAEPLLLSGYQGMKLREAKILAYHKVRLTEAGERIVQLYEAWAKPEQAAAWKARLSHADFPDDVFAGP
jgi:serine/threonine protein kinase/tetratricopeptide (TPR) repeat protein